MNDQTKIVLLGAGVAAAAKFGFGKDWKTALLFGAAAIVASTLYDSFKNPISEPV
jgi:hypothetical protein